MRNVNCVCKRALSGFLSLVMAFGMITSAFRTASATESDLPVLDMVKEYNTKASTAIKTITSMVNASDNATKYSTLL